MTTVSFPFRREVDRIVAGTGHIVTYTETSYGATRALNNTDQAGGALAFKPELKRKRPRFEAWLPHPRANRLLMARIAPKEWEEGKLRDYSAIRRDQVKAEIFKRLKPLSPA